MGQRSQVYVCVKGAERWNKEQSLTALYFQWNYGTRMVSRAVALISYLKSMLEYLHVYDEHTIKSRIQKIANINFDMGASDVDSSDIAKELWAWNESKPSDLFCQDNNDGYLFILVDCEKKNIKYAFSTDYELNVLNATDYVVRDSDRSNIESYFKEHREHNWLYDKEEEKFYDNANYLNDFEMLTLEEVQEHFINYNWTIENEIIDKEKVFSLYNLIKAIPTEALTYELKESIRKIDYYTYSKIISEERASEN